MVVIDPGAIKTDLISVDSNQILGIKLQKSCEHVRAYGPRNILWLAGRSLPTPVLDGWPRFLNRFDAAFARLLCPLVIFSICTPVYGYMNDQLNSNAAVVDIERAICCFAACVNS